MSQRKTQPSLSISFTFAPAFRVAGDGGYDVGFSSDLHRPLNPSCELWCEARRRIMTFPARYIQYYDEEGLLSLLMVNRCPDLRLDVRRLCIVLGR